MNVHADFTTITTITTITTKKKCFVIIVIVVPYRHSGTRPTVHPRNIDVTPLPTYTRPLNY
jgi:hypothetical protein